MSASDDGATTRASGSSSGEGEPAKSSKRRKITASSQQTAVSLFEEGASTNGDQDEQVDKAVQDEVLLTNMETFFDEPVWRQVVGKLGKRTDIDNCSIASPFFGDLLQEKREREVVLPTVFGILARRYCDEENKDESYKETNVESIPWQRPESSEEPHRMTGLWKCRLVSKKWNAAIENIHRNEDAGHYQMEDDFKKAENRKVGGEWGTELFYTELRVDQFLGHFQATHYVGGEGRVSKKCPFLGRAVEFGFDWRAKNKQTYLNKIMEMFEKFGDQVFYFQFYWSFRPCSESLKYRNHVYIYLILRQMVELMPNLKVLRINYSDFPSLFPSKELQMFEQEIQASPFPQITSLEMISADQIPGPLCNHLVHQNRQLSRLEFDRIDFNGNCSLFTDKLPNLSQLSLLRVNSLDIFEAFERYSATLNLEKFNLQFTGLCPFVTWSRVFNLIGSKLNSNACTDLVLGMPDLTDSDADAEKNSVLLDSLLCRLQLPNIERCQVISYARFCMDFLLGSKNSLREIKLKLYSDPEYEGTAHEDFRGKQLIKFLGIEENMEQSNIGKEILHLSKLKVVSYECNISRHYTIEPNGVVKVEREKKLY